MAVEVFFSLDERDFSVEEEVVRSLMVSSGVVEVEVDEDGGLLTGDEEDVYVLCCSFRMADCEMEIAYPSISPTRVDPPLPLIPFLPVETIDRGLRRVRIDEVDDVWTPSEGD